MPVGTARVAKNSRRGSKPGQRRGGRKKGTPNKTTATIKAAICEAFARIKVKGQAGGVDSLIAWGETQPGEFYKLWGRLAPQEVVGAEGGPVEIRVRFVRDPRA